MIPEIQLLQEKFSGKSWNVRTQEQFIDELAQSSFLRARDRHLIKLLAPVTELIAHLKRWGLLI